MQIKKTKKGNKYIHTSIKDINKINKELADKGKGIFEQYSEPTCQHGDLLGKCFICNED